MHNVEKKNEMRKKEKVKRKKEKAILSFPPFPFTFSLN